jgi:superfamily I DNA and/or RNA helicase
MRIAPNFLATIKKRFNKSKAAAIERVCSTDRGFTLLQGPPGTGKTHTILGILSAFINSEPLSGKQPYILVCAPSNAAIDEVATRVISEGLIDGNGNLRKDMNVVRIGSRNQNALALRDKKDQRERDYFKQTISDDLQSIFLANKVEAALAKLQGMDPEASVR